MIKVVSMRKQGNKVVETWGFCYLVTVESNIGHNCNKAVQLLLMVESVTAHNFGVAMDGEV
jgi:aspartyl/asparaginyl beta-hydroxylase (cupin superfamily)